MVQHRSTLSDPANTLTVEIKLAPETLAALSGIFSPFRTPPSERVAAIAELLKQAALSDDVDQMPAIPPTERCEIGKRVRHVRVFRGLNLLQVASISGYSDSVIGKIESNVSKPKPPVVKALAAALGCDESWLLTGLGDPGLDRQQEASA